MQNILETIGQELLCLAKQKIAEYAAAKMSQAIVLRGESGKVHSFFAPLEDLPAAEDAICRQLSDASDTGITHMAVLWENGQLDLPSHRLRSRLVILDAKNRDALILLQGEKGPGFLPLHKTL